MRRQKVVPDERQLERVRRPLPGHSQVRWGPLRLFSGLDNNDDEEAVASVVSWERSRQPLDQPEERRQQQQQWRHLARQHERRNDVNSDVAFNDADDDYEQPGGEETFNLILTLSIWEKAATEIRQDRFSLISCI